MDHTRSFHPASPLMKNCEPTLPASWYYDPAQYAREIETVWARNWVYAGRVNDLRPMTLKRLTVAGQNLILVTDQDGTIRCFHNVCRHRGAEICSVDEKPLQSRLITCPYHNWSYSFAGDLAATPFVTRTADFRKEDHSLFPVHTTEWNGFLFVCLAGDPPDFAGVPDLGTNAYDNWPMTSLVSGHTMVSELACNWKIFWENFNECLHCPSIHPELSDLVPVYSKGVMAEDELADWTPSKVASAGGLKAGARSWTMNGERCGAEFTALTEAERRDGYHFVTLLPSMFIVAHVDYVRAVSLTPLGPERTLLKAEWLFPEETLSAPDFDLANVVDFASMVIRQDGEACEMNQRGLRSSKYLSGTLVPQEYAIHRFHEWVRHVMKEACQ